MTENGNIDDADAVKVGYHRAHDANGVPYWYRAEDAHGNDVTLRQRLECASSETLRDALRTHGLPVSGTKAQRAQRLVDIGMTREQLEAEHGWRARASGGVR